MKSVAKEIMILILLILAVILILGILFYNYVPFNKIVPSKVEAYKTAESVKNEIDENIVSYPKQNIVFEITDEDLALYRQTKSYNPGKSNPFALEASTSVATNINSSGSTSGTTSSGNVTNSVSAEQKASSKVVDTKLK